MSVFSSVIRLGDRHRLLDDNISESHPTTGTTLCNQRQPVDLVDKDTVGMFIPQGMELNNKSNVILWRSPDAFIQRVAQR